MKTSQIETLLFDGLTEDQRAAVHYGGRRLLVVAGAGSGKTEVMARRIAWWVGVQGIAKSRIVAFTFTERAAEEMKFRIRKWIEKITPRGEETSLGDMYVGTIHGYCLAKIRENWPDAYHNYDIVDEAARAALVSRGFNGVLALAPLREALGLGQFATIETFARAYDQLHEHNLFEVKLPAEDPPFQLGAQEREWCKQAELLTDVGKAVQSQAFGTAAARYYAHLKCRRFLDFSTSQTEFIRQLSGDKNFTRMLYDDTVHLVVDEIQDINNVQLQLIESIIGNGGKLTAVGDHRQAIYGFRGAKVQIIAELWEKFHEVGDSHVIELRDNFRSTPRIIDLANCWTGTISPLLSMKVDPMRHGNKERIDQDPSHVALVNFADRKSEAAWIARAVKALIPTDTEGARHDKREGRFRGLSLSDVAILVRSSTDVRTYMDALNSAGIPSVVRAGPDLFSQPEVLLFVSALAMTAGIEQFFGAEHNPKSLPNRIAAVLGCVPEPEAVLLASAARLQETGLRIELAVQSRLLFAAKALHERIANGKSLSNSEAAILRTPSLRDFLISRNTLRRVFPQQLFHMLLSEACVEQWDTCAGRGQSAMFHLGALSALITGIETPGWTSTGDYHWQIIGLCQYGAEEGRTQEQPLMVQPEAVSIGTIHSAKGLEFPCVFLADVNAQRFPSSRATQKVKLPLDGEIVDEIDVAGLSDTPNHDGERRLMYVALTRAERFLVVSHSGTRTSKFVKELRDIVRKVGGSVTDQPEKILQDLKYAPKEHKRNSQLSTSFSDLRYYLECPHDFYLRKVLGFAPTIDQAFGYGRGVHNLLRAVHADPKHWADLSSSRAQLEAAVQVLIDKGLFYLRYTTGEPADNMRAKGLRVVADYVGRYARELARVTFEPEKEFETLLEYENGEGGALISGAIDVVRQDNPPSVTLIDFKSGNPDSDNRQKLDEDEMRLQVAIYAIAAKKELEFKPEQGLVRYLDADDPDRSELEVPLNDDAIGEAKRLVSKTVTNIRDRAFKLGPPAARRQAGRCRHCDFIGICGMPEAISHKQAVSRDW